jgi:hypothetical protein
MEQHLKTFALKHKSSPVAHVAYVFKDDYFLWDSNQACHAGLKNHISKNHPWNLPVKYILSGLQDNPFSKEELVLFINWIVSESPWKNCFLLKDAETIYANRCYVLDPAQPGNLVGGAAIATRHPSEWPRLFKFWLYLVQELGYDKSKAFLVSHLFQAKNSTTLFPVVIQEQRGWHQSVADGYNKKYWDNFLNCTPVNPGLPYIENPTYNGVGGVWGYGGLETNKFKAIRPIKKVDNVIDRHIFRKAKTIGAGYSFNDKAEIESLVKQIEEMVYAA